MPIAERFVHGHVLSRSNWTDGRIIECGAESQSLPWPLPSIPIQSNSPNIVLGLETTSAFMMGWPYEFLSLSPEEKQARRHVLDHYAAIAHYSALLPIFIGLAIRLISLLIRYVINRTSQWRKTESQGEYQQVPADSDQQLDSPEDAAAKTPCLSKPGKLALAPAPVVKGWRRLRWWLRDDIFFAGSCWGQRDEWVLGLIWTLWLTVLCFLDTGRDYFHMTKRFGIVPVSQLPILYLLALKPLNPISWIFSTSHESTNRYHRVLGRIIYALTLIHIILYNIYYILEGIWLVKITSFIILCGVFTSLAFHAIFGTALSWAKNWSYRVFYITHIICAYAILGLLFFHAHSARIYLFECFVIIIVNTGLRRYNTSKAPTSIEAIPGTTSFKITAPLPPDKLDQLRRTPASFMYVTAVTAPSTKSHSPVMSGRRLITGLVSNPFTVASMDDNRREITIIARQRSGPLSAHLVQSADDSDSPGEIIEEPSSPGPDPRLLQLGFEGPYGTMTHAFKSLLSSGASQVLIIAGGVGGTFAVPIYQAVAANVTSKVQLIWAIRGPGDAAWAIKPSTHPSETSIADDPNVQLFLTGSMGVSDDADNAAGGAPASNTGESPEGIELQRAAARRQATTLTSLRRRPDLRKIVDGVFESQGPHETVAVLVCGPAEMAREVKRRVRHWGMQGRDIWWHDEGFGW